MEWFIQRFNTVFAGIAPFDMFGCGLVISVCVWIAVIAIKALSKVIDMLVALVCAWIDRHRKMGRQ